MALADGVEGGLRGGQVFRVMLPDGTPVDVTGSTGSGELRDLWTNQVRPIAGTLTPVGTSGESDQGDVHWEYDAADLVHAQYRVQFAFAFPSGPTPYKTFRDRWYVAPGSV